MITINSNIVFSQVNNPVLREQSILDQCSTDAKSDSDVIKVILRITQSNNVMISLYPLGSEGDIGQAQIVALTEISNDNIYRFTYQNKEYVTEPKILNEICYIDKTERRAITQEIVHIEVKCGFFVPQATQCTCIPYDKDDNEIPTFPSGLGIENDPIVLNEINPFISQFQPPDRNGNCPTTRSWDIPISTEPILETTTQTPTESNNIGFTAEQQRDIAKGLEGIFKWFFDLIKSFLEKISNFFVSIINSIFPKPNIDCVGRSLSDISDSSTSTKDGITILNYAAGSANFHYDKCNTEDISKIEEVYCKKDRGISNDELIGFEELTCLDDYSCTEGRCLHKCNKETQLTCESSGNSWCCDKLENYRLRECSSKVKQCNYRKVLSWYESGLGIRWLNLNDPMPEECKCENSALVIFGDATMVLPQSYNFLNYELSKYYETKEKNGECTFGIRATDMKQVDNIVYNIDTRVSHIGRFKYLLVATHSDSRGTLIDSGGSFGALLCKDGFAEMISCKVGQSKTLFFDAPKIVNNFCVQALPGSVMKVSKSDVEFSDVGFGSIYDQGELYCTKGNWECWKCTSQNPPKATKVNCP